MIENNDIFYTLTNKICLGPPDTVYVCFLHTCPQNATDGKNFVCPQLEFGDKWYVSSFGILVL